MKTITISLLFIILTISINGNCNDPLAVLTNNPKLLVSPDSKTFKNALTPAPWPFRVHEETVQKVMNNFIRELQNGETNLSLSWSVYESARLPIFLTFPSSSQYFQAKDKLPVFLATIQIPTKVIAFFAVTFVKSKQGKQEGVIEYIMSPEGNGLAEKILIFLKEGFASVFNLKKLYAELEWAGREYWARPQFGFNLSELQPLVCIGRCEIDFEVMMRFNFLRFLKINSIQFGDLVFVKNNKIYDFDLRKIRSPTDLLNVQKRDGSKIEIDTYRSHNQIQKKLLHVGSAFLLADHHPYSQQISYISVGEKDYSDKAMPPWFGVIDFASLKSCEGIFN